MGVRFRDCELDLDRWELRRDDQPVALEPRAMQILGVLVANRHRVVTKTELLDSVWGDRFVGESALTTQVKEIRRAVGDDGRSQQVVRTVHGQGYRFVAPVDGAIGATGPSPVGPPVVAVLPFDLLSPDESSAHVAAGLTSDVTTALAKHRSLRVLTRATAAGYGARPDAVSALRADFGVRYVVEGTVHLQREPGDDEPGNVASGGHRLRVTVTLTDVDTGTSRWSERYERTVADLFDVLDEIVEVLAATIAPTVGHAERERVRRRGASDLEAWDLHHLGVAHLFRFTAEDNREAQRLLDRARTLAPDVAESHAWWAYAVVLGMTYWDTTPGPDLLDAALAATDDALELDESDAATHMIRGRVQLARCDYGHALVDNERAIELNPTFAAAYCGLGDSLCYEARYDEAIAQFERSVALGSHDPQRWAFLSYGALALLFAGRHHDAVEWSERAEGLPNHQYWSVAHRTVALALAGATERAARAASQLRRERPDFSVAFARRKLFYLKRRDQLDTYLAGLEAAGVPAR